MEKWKPVPGFNNRIYASDKGKIFQACWRDKLGALHKGRILSQRYSQGYLHCNITTDKQKTYLVHRLVAMAWLPNEQNKPYINHKNGKKDDNAVSNLEWCTPKENTQHAINTLCKYRDGCDNYASKLTPDDIAWIQDNYIPRDSKFGLNAISQKFNMDRHNISKIIHCKSYKRHVDPNKEIHSYASGENIHNAKFSNDLADEIRQKYKSGKYSYKQLADEYQCGKTTIGYIITRKHYY